MSDEKAKAAEAAAVEKTVEAKVAITDEIKQMIDEAAVKASEAQEKSRKNFFLTDSDENAIKAAKADEQKEFITKTKFLIQGNVHALKALSSNVDANGGFIVPETFQRELNTLTEDYSEIIRAASGHQMESNVMRLNEVSYQVQTSKKAENYGTASDTTPTFGEPVLTTELYTGSTTLSEVLLEDTEISNLLSELQSQFAESIAFEMQDSMLNSSVSGSEGLFVVSGRTIVTQGTSNTLGGFSNISWDDLNTMKTNLFKLDKLTTGVAGKVEAGRGTYVMSMDTWNAVATSKAVDSGNYFTQSINPQGAIEYRAWGRPVIVVNEAPSPTTSGTDYVLYTDLSRHLHYGFRRDMKLKINTSGTSAAGVNLNTQDARELVVSARFAHVASLAEGIIALNS